MHIRHAEAPKEHNRWDESAWAESFQEYIGQRLEAGVRHEEHRQTDIVLAVAHIQIICQPVDIGIADVRPIYLGC